MCIFNIWKRCEVLNQVCPRSRRYMKGKPFLAKIYIKKREVGPLGGAFRQKLCWIPPSPGESVTLGDRFSQTGVITFLPRGAAAIDIIDVSVIVRCPQSKNWLESNWKVHVTSVIQHPQALSAVNMPNTRSLIFRAWQEKRAIHADCYTVHLFTSREE